MNDIKIKTYSEPYICEKEILRYAGCNESDIATKKLIQECINEIKDKLTYKVCYCELDVSLNGSLCDFGLIKITSVGLAKNLSSCKSVILFASTIGIETDRLISKYGRISPSKALIMQAIGTERIEALCDVFCEDISSQKKTALTPRFSPGYGDLCLDIQKNIFDILKCQKNIGLYLTNSLLMSPSKSVTAFVGISDNAIRKNQNKCSYCNNVNCSYRSVKI